jgi:hypothetical protein
VSTAKYPDHATHHAPVELEPDLLEILQAEAPLQCLPVRVEGIVRTQQMPARDRTGRTITVDALGFVPLLRADPTRAFAEITSFDQDMILAYSRNAAVGDTNTERVGKGIRIKISARTEVYVMAFTATTVVSMGQERWAQE